MLISVLGLMAAAPVQAQESVTPAQVEALKKKIGSIDQWLAKAERDRSSLEQTLAANDQAISRLTRESRELRERAANQAVTLAQLKEKEAELTRTLNDQRDSLRRQIRQAWMAGDTPAIKVLLNEIDPHKISRTMTYYEYFSRDTVARLQQFNQSLAELERTQQAAVVSKLRLNTLRNDVTDRKEKLESQKRQRQQTLAKLEEEIDDRESERGELVADRARLEKLLKEVQEAIAGIPSPNESKPFQALRAKLPWPARGNVSSQFGDSLAHGQLSRSGLLIGTGEETDISAVHYGRVVFSNWLRGFGLMTIIDHGDGYMSLYGHSSSLLKSPGDWVDAGEVIAVSGQSGGTEDAAVYFEIRHKGKPQNPQKWLKSQ
ncbi:MAG: peptidoglycan DD-metalloendopeptidase family protein [Oleiphilaceae bacterium]|nr:peptidoglycan DD-metalloendopeptidase family protein [Oleiphilaceae bacterium]